MGRRFNQHQPIRLTHHPETGEPLLYRTFPVIQKKMPRFMSLNYQLCQIRLYRAIRSGEYPNNASAAEIREWIGTSHTILGSTIINAVQYEARKLVNRRSLPKPLVIYSFGNLLEFQYGLEWQICTWLRSFLQERDAQEVPFSGPEAAEYELDLLASMPEGEYMDEFEKPLSEVTMQVHFNNRQMKLDWNKLVEGLKEANTEPKKLRVMGPPPKSLAI